MANNNNQAPPQTVLQGTYSVSPNSISGIGISSPPGPWSLQASNGSSSTNWITTFKVDGDADFYGEVRIKGQSLNAVIERIEQRLAILVPDPARLERYEALRQAYEHYLILERLLIDDK
jgi:hypothetical protein